MISLFENSKLVCKLPDDDPECRYVKEMMEMPPEVLRGVLSSGDNINVHGIVPRKKLPKDYHFGNVKLNHFPYAKKESNVSRSQNSSNSNSTLRMESDERDDENRSDEDNKLKQLHEDLQVTEEEDDDDSDSDDGNNKEDDEQMFIKTLNECSQKIPQVKPVNHFKMHYKNPKLDDNNINHNKKDVADDASCTGDTEPFEESNDSTKAGKDEVIKFISILAKSKPQINLSTFEPLYREINRKRKCDTNVNMNNKVKDVTPSKVKKLDDKDRSSDFEIRIGKNEMEICLTIKPELFKDKAVLAILESKKKDIALQSNEKPSLMTQESRPFSRSDRSEDKRPTEDNCIRNERSQFFAKAGNDINQQKKSKPSTLVLPQNKNYSSAKVAPVTGNVNCPTTYSESGGSKDILATDVKPTPKNYVQKQESNVNSKSNNKESVSQSIISNDHVADESTVIKGLFAIDKMKQNLKADFIARMRALDTEKWLVHANGLQSKANEAEGHIDYPPLIILALRKFLIYNYSLDVKNQGKKCHETYLENSERVRRISNKLVNIYRDHIVKTADSSPSIVWNTRLIKAFSLTMLIKIKAILGYRAFRSVSIQCKELHEKLRQSGILDDRTNNSLVADGHHGAGSPLSMTSTPSHTFGVVQSNGSPTSPASISHRIHSSMGGGGGGVVSGASGLTLSTDIKQKLQRYVEITTIINNAYNDWLSAERNHLKFCTNGPKYDDAWRNIELQIIEKTGGIVINSIDESIPFVITYLDGFIRFMNDFQKNLHPSRNTNSDSRF